MFRTRRAAGTSLTPSTSRRVWPSCTRTSRPPSRPTPRPPGWGSASTGGCWAWGRLTSSPRTCSWVRSQMGLSPRLVTKQADNRVSPLNSSCKLCQRTKPRKRHSAFICFFFMSTKRNSTLFMNPFMHIPKVKILKLHTMLQCPSFRMPWMMCNDSCTAVSECHHVLIPYLDTRGLWPPASGPLCHHIPVLLLSPIVPASVSASLLSSTDISDHQQHLFCINSLTF